MEGWEDTVIHAKDCNTNLGIIGAICNCGAEHQAEISFKAGEDKGKQEGIQIGRKEVVEDMENAFNIAKPGYTISAVFKCLEKWQAFLKERLEK